MTLSAFLRTASSLTIPAENTNYVGFIERQLQRAGATRENCTLWYSTPIFLADGEDKDCRFWAVLPSESKPAGKVTNVVFLEAFFEKLRIVHHWTFAQLAELAEKIEAVQ